MTPLSRIRQPPAIAVAPFARSKRRPSHAADENESRRSIRVQVNGRPNGSAARLPLGGGRAAARIPWSVSLACAAAVLPAPAQAAGGCDLPDLDSEGAPTSSEIATSRLLVATFLVILGIIFEAGQHKIVHSASRHTRPIVTSLFQELTLLGFVGLFLFLVEQSGLLQTLSAAAFGEGWEGLLVVHFHQIHMILFLVMVVYLATVLLLMRVGLRLTRVWRVMEEEAHFRERLMQKYAKERMEAEKKEIMNARAPSSRSLSRKGTMMGKALKSGLTQAAGRGAKKLSAHDSVLYSMFRLRFIFPAGANSTDAVITKPHALSSDGTLRLTEATAHRYRMKNHVHAFPVRDHIRVDKHWGVSEGRFGDWLVISANDDCVVQTDAEFKAIYSKVEGEPGRYRHKSTVLAKLMHTDFTVTAKDGSTRQARSGNYLIQEADHSQTALTDHEFQLMYEPLSKAAVVERDMDWDLNEDFDFAEYLSMITGHTIADMVDLEIMDWLFLELITILLWALWVTVSNEHLFNAILMCGGYLVAFVVFRVHRKLLWVRNQLACIIVDAGETDAVALQAFGIDPDDDGGESDGGKAERVRRRVSEEGTSHRAQLDGEHTGPSRARPKASLEAVEEGRVAETSSPLTSPATRRLRYHRSGTDGMEKLGSLSVAKFKVLMYKDRQRSRSAEISSPSRLEGSATFQTTPAGLVPSTNEIEWDISDDDASTEEVEIPARPALSREYMRRSGLNDKYMPQFAPPPYTTLPWPRPLGCVEKCCGARPPSRHENLFWFGSLGKQFLFQILRSVPLTMAIYTAVLSVNLMDSSVGVCRHEPLQCLWQAPVAFFPVAVVAYMLPRLFRLFVLVTNIEQMTKRRAVMEVVRRQRTQKAMRALRMLSAMKVHSKRLWEASKSSRLDGSLSGNSMDMHRAAPAGAAAAGGAGGAATGVAVVPAQRAQLPGSVPGGADAKVAEAAGMVALSDSSDTDDELLVTGDGALDVEENKVAPPVQRATVQEVAGELVNAAVRVYGHPESIPYLRRKMELQEVFTLFDRDSNGTVDARDVVSVFELLGMSDESEAVARQMVKEVDVSNKGYIVFDDFFNWMAFHDGGAKESTEEINKFIFKIIDRDGSGEISVEELRHTLASLGEVMSEADVLHIVKEADHDGSGTISLHEFSLLLENYADHMSLH